MIFKYIANIIICFIFFLSKSSIVKGYDSIYFYCNNRLYIDFDGLGSNEITSLCSLLNQDDRFVVQISKQKTYVQQYDYTIESEAFYKTQCGYTRTQCKYGFGISIFPNVGQIRVTAGSISKNQLTKQQRVEVINSIVPALKQSNYYEAISHGIARISASVPYNNSHVNVPNRNNSSSSFGFFSFVIFILCPICCCFALCYYYSTKNKEHYMEEEIRKESYWINDHINRLLELIMEIRKNSPPIISINDCLICMKGIQMGQESHVNIEMTLVNNCGNNNYQTPTPMMNTQYPTAQEYYNQSLLPQSLPQNVNQSTTRFACQHLYHSTCLSERNINHCLMCSNSDKTREIVMNMSNVQVIDENNVKIMIENLNAIYSQKELNAYARSYPNEYDSLNTTMMIGLTAAWGVTAVCATGLLMNSYHNDVYAMNPQGINMQYYNPGVDTAGVAYDVGNNNNNGDGVGTYSGNYGNYSGDNNNDNDLGDTIGGDY